jgi:hypothetical protein
MTANFKPFTPILILNINGSEHCCLHGIWKALSNIGVIIGSVAVGTWRAAARLTAVETKIDNFETRLTRFEGRLDNAFGSRSPIALFPRGMHILNVSGLKRYIDNRKEELLDQCRAGNRPTTPPVKELIQHYGIEPSVKIACTSQQNTRLVFRRMPRPHRYSGDELDGTKNLRRRPDADFPRRLAGCATCTTIPRHRNRFKMSHCTCASATLGSGC